MRKLLLSGLVLLGSLHALSQAPVSIEKTRFQTGLTINPQMLFAGGIELGAYTGVEHQFKSKFGLIGGLEVRNKWIQLRINNAGISTESIKSHYSITSMIHGGFGYTFKNRKKPELNSFYLTVNPYAFFFKETVNHSTFTNTYNGSMIRVNYGITWSNTKVSKKGRTWNSQFYIPLLGGPLSDELRFMSLRIGYVFTN